MIADRRRSVRPRSFHPATAASVRLLRCRRSPTSSPSSARSPTRCAADERVFLLGEDIGHFGGAFGVTKGLLEEFGDDRVIDTPIAEEGFVGAAIGAAWMGERPVVELQFADFASCAFDPIVTRRGQDALALGHPAAARDPLPDRRRRARRPVPRLLARGLVRAAPPGSRSSAPAASRTPTGCCAARSRTTTRCCTSSTRALYRRLRDEAPAEDHRVPIGSARDRAQRLRRRRSSPTARASTSRSRADELADEASIEVVDLRTLWPLDRDDDARVGRADLARCSCCRRPRARSGVAERRLRARRVARASSCSTRRPRSTRRSTRPCRSRPSSRTRTCRRAASLERRLRELLAY